MELNGVTVYAVYQESLGRIKAGRGDYRDQVIVSQWLTGLKHMEQIKAVKKSLDQIEKQLRILTYCNDLSDTRVNGNVIMPGLKTYLEGLSDSSVLAH